MANEKFPSSQNVGLNCEAQAFLDDLEKAKALSLETLELDRIRREHLVQEEFKHLVQPSHTFSSKNSSNIHHCYETMINVQKATPSMDSKTVHTDSRRRLVTCVNNSDSSLPPPPRRQPSSVHSQLDDLIVFSPVEKERKAPLEELEDAMGLSSTNSQYASSNISSGSYFKTNGANIMPNCIVSSLSSPSNDKKIKLGATITSKEISHMVSSPVWYNSSPGTITPLPLFGPTVFHSFPENNTVPLFSPPIPQRSIGSFSFPSSPVTKGMLGMPTTPSSNFKEFSNCSPSFHSSNQNLQRLFSSSPVVPSSSPVLDQSLSVLKIFEKKRNSNLIDLADTEELFKLASASDCASSNQPNIASNTDDLLHSFDPLLISSNKTSNGHPSIIAQPNSYTQTSHTISAFEDNFDPLKHSSKDLTKASDVLNDKNDHKIYESEESPPPPPVPPRPKTITHETDIDGVNVPVRPKSSPPRPASNRHGDIFDSHSSENGKYICMTWMFKQRRQSRSYETIRVQKGKLEPNSELEVFCQKVITLRSEFIYDDYHTNVGLVISPTLESLREESTSVKLVIHSSLTNKPILFTCDVTTTVEHIISHVICTIFDDISDIDFKKFVLKVYGLAEYLSADSSLHDYEYVHHCQKYDEDVQLTLIRIEDLKRPLARTSLDDKNDVDLKPEDLLEMEIQYAVPYQTISILLETFEREVEKMREQALKSNAEVLQSQGVVQAVKAICSILSQVEISGITEAVEGLVHVALQFGKTKNDEIITGFNISEEHTSTDNETLTVVELTKKLPNTPNIRMELIHIALEHLNQAVRELLDIYCRSFYVDFHIPLDTSTKTKPIKEVSCIVDTLLVHVSAVHRLPMWSSNYENFIIGCELYYGTHLLCDAIETKPAKIFVSFHEQLVFDEWLLFPTVLLCTLPRESRLVFTLYGLKTISSEAKTPDAGQVQRVALGWSAIKLFRYDGTMQQGSFLCGLWPDEGNKSFGLVISNYQTSNPILQISLPDYGCILIFPSVVKDYPCQRREFESLDATYQQELLNIIERSCVAEITMEERELLWEKRHFLYDIPQALPRVLQAAHSWDWACLADIYSMLREWKSLNPIDALELLLPSFPDIEVRKTAISWIKNLGSDELCDYLPQLVQALKFEMWDNSPTAMFLLERSLTSIRVAHHLYWLLKQNLDDKRCNQRIRLILNAMLAISGRAMRKRFDNQEELMKNLAIVANKIKNIKDSLRLANLFHELESIHYMLSDNLTSLPLSPSLEVTGLEVKMCSYFTSNTLPLKLNFKSAEPETKPLEAIFKVGDDLRQDTLTIQMIRIMDKLWLKEGLDLRIVTFSCVATGYKEGIVEMVKESETLRKIQTEHGLTGSFKDRPIAEWLQKHNPSELEYQQAVENFTYSCAGYSVATYILGICDRHNDNIMLKTSGHLFHIDFGKFLGDAQMFGSIKRDRVPFVLTSDMAYVINGGDKPSSKFQHFVELCCQAFNIIRKHGNLFLNLFQLMSASGIPGVTLEAVSYINKALLPENSDAESAAMFARMIEESLKSWFTQFNFFIHNLAQLRFTGDHNDGTLLTFIPKTYTMETEGKIKSLEIIGYQKRYEPEKYYVYILKVEREAQPDPSILFRSYREVCELQQKLCTRFPLAKYRYHSLPKSVSLGRSNIRQVAEKRKSEIESFLQSLWNMADEIKHCDLIYTFCHPLLRDQQEGIAHLQKVKEPRNPHCAGLIHGQVKLSMRFHENTFFIMVMHARNLNSSKNADPDPYVKIYLVPDPNKITKRKTKVIRKNCHPTFMEMLHYRFPLEVIRMKTLQVSVWDYDRMAENTFLGAVSIPLNNIDLSSETTSWYSLGNLYR